MFKLERVELLRSKKDYLYLFYLSIFLLSLSLSYQYYHYKKLIQFNSQLVHVEVLKQYTKTKVTKKGRLKIYQVLKLKSDDGFHFYSITSKNTPNYKGKRVLMKIWASHITFLEYLKGFFAFSKIIDVDKNLSLKRKIVSFIKAQHSKSDISDIYLALFLAKPLPYSLQQHFSNLGISHLIAISGFHLGVLSAILFFLIKYPYKYLQNNYFPYRSYQRDSFYIIAIFLCFYMLFLDSPPSLLRSYMLLVVGFFLYDQGLKVISMQTLFITFILLISLFVQLLFSIGFFLSIAGVFYIFLFLIHFQNKSKLLQFILIPLWIYLLMLPYSLALFGNFSLYHPLSIVWTSLFTLFYPLAIFLHLIGEGNLLDHTVTLLLKLDPKALHLHLSSYFIFVEILLSLGAIFNKKALYLLLLYVISIFIYAIYHVT